MTRFPEFDRRLAKLHGSEVTIRCGKPELGLVCAPVAAGRLREWSLPFR